MIEIWVKDKVIEIESCLIPPELGTCLQCKASKNVKPYFCRRVKNYKNSVKSLLNLLFFYLRKVLQKQSINVARTNTTILKKYITSQTIFWYLLYNIYLHFLQNLICKISLKFIFINLIMLLHKS